MPTFDETTVGGDSAESTSGLSRRSVVRAGAVAAWSVPLVQLAAAAPSFAASGPADLSTSTIGTRTRGGAGSKDVTFPINIINTNTLATTALTVTIPCALGGLSNTQVAPTGWTAVSSGGSSNNRTLVTYTKTVQLGGNASTGVTNFVVANQSSTPAVYTPIAVNPGVGTPAAFVNATAI